MPVVLAFGDSNTWGHDPADGSRFPAGVRWPTVMRDALGPTVHLVEEGLRGRTTVWDDPLEGGRCGLAYLAPCLLSHEPVDVVIITLGTNDLKRRFSAAAEDIARGAERLVATVAASRVGPGGTAPKILLVAPPPVAASVRFSESWAGAYETSRGFAAEYRAAAARQRVAFLDAGAHIRSSETDGIHFDADQHALLGQAVAEAVRPLLAA